MYDIAADISAGSRLTSNIKMLYGTESKIYCYSCVLVESGVFVILLVDCTYLNNYMYTYFQSIDMSSYINGMFSFDLFAYLFIQISTAEQYTYLKQYSTM